jgi:alkylated DNA repair dioxygenase AlkB
MSESKSKSDSEYKSESKSKSKSESKSESKIESNSKSESKSKIESKSKSNSKLQVKVGKVNGLFYIDNIVIKTNNVINKLDKLEWTSLSNTKTSRLVQHYGYKYNYVTYKINEKCEEMPSFIKKYRDALIKICLKMDLIDNTYEFNQCIINNYECGQGISPHIDVKEYGSVIGCFTIGSGSMIVFNNKDLTEEIYVKPGSLYIMSGDARYKWTHSIPSRKTDIIDGNKIKRSRRISLTFRFVKE